MLSFGSISEAPIAVSTTVADANAYMAGATATASAGTLGVAPEVTLSSVTAATGISGLVSNVDVTPTAVTATLAIHQFTAQDDVRGATGAHPSGQATATFKLGADAHHTFTAFGNAQLSTAQKKFGTSSLLLDGTGDYVKSSANDLQDANFTVEFWIYTDDRLQNAHLWDGQVANSGLALAITDLGKIRIIQDNTILGTYNNGLSDNTWHHIALVGNSNFLTVYVDGTSRGQANVPGGYGSYPNQPYYIGCRHNETQFFDGYIDEFRATNTSLYSGTFTPSTSALTDTGDTGALLHFDGTNGSTTITSTDTVDAITANGKASIVLSSTTVTSSAGTAGFDAKASITLDAATADADLAVNTFEDEDAQASTTLSGVSATTAANWDTTDGIYAVQVVFTATDFERKRCVNIVPYGNYKVYVTR